MGNHGLSTAMLTPAQYIRERVFNCYSQQSFAQMLEVKQPTVSRWETGAAELSRRTMDRIRELAAERRIRFDERWFFRVPDDLDAGTYRDAAA